MNRQQSSILHCFAQLAPGLELLDNKGTQQTNSSAMAERGRDRSVLRAFIGSASKYQGTEWQVTLTDGIVIYLR